ncbi:MAG: site-specific DNA-methyltransferase [Desulfurellales bacterium]|nr:MAG: site-specific DNA-methyltransferase [Desulfurellales bacterium]
MRTEVIHGDCIDVMRSMPDKSIDLIVTDPPYFKVKGEAWDRQWDDADAFIRWLDTVAEQWHRLLRPNGSLYVFAWPKMAARVELLIGEQFNVLQRITWAKPAFSTKAEMNAKEGQRQFFPVSEAIIFAEHKGADNMAKGEAGYAAKCDELRGFVFEPLRTYLVTERDQAGFTNRRIDEAFREKTGNPKSGMAGHWFGRSQWALPTAENYAWLRELFSRGDGHEYLRREYEDLRREYEDLRRPFSVTTDVPYTDVWTFPTVSTRSGKHSCEKPLDMIEHIVRASSRPGAVVLDSFAGSGVVGEAAIRLGRSFVGIEADPKWVERARARLTAATPRA